MTGTVTTINNRRGYGFIALPDGGGDVFFHCTDLADSLEFDEQLVERRVEFEAVEGRKGPRAANIRAAD